MTQPVFKQANGVTAYFIPPNILSGGIICASIFPSCLIVYVNRLLRYLMRLGTCFSFGLKMYASHIDEPRTCIAYWLTTFTSGRDGDPRASREKLKSSQCCIVGKGL